MGVYNEKGFDELKRVGTYLVICVGGGCGDAVAREATVSVERAARIVWFRGRN